MFSIPSELQNLGERLVWLLILPPVMDALLSEAVQPPQKGQQLPLSHAPEPSA